MTVKSFSVGYDPVSESNVFSRGGTLSGRVTLELSKDADVKALSVKMKGKSEVMWSEGDADADDTFYSKEKFFTIKHFLIPEGQGKTPVERGCHVFPFFFHIPDQDLPSSFQGEHGSVRYTLEARLSRSLRIDSKASAEFRIVSKHSLPESLKVPQHGSTTKKMKLFGSGSVAMDVHLEKSGFYQGEGLKVVVSIQNKSSRDVRPKFLLYCEQSFYAEGRSTVSTSEVLKEVGDEVEPSGGQTLTKVLIIPASVTTTISNCKNIRVEHKLKVYLDVKFASDPQVTFPIVILPVNQSVEEAPPYYGMDPFSAVPAGNVPIPPYGPSYGSAPPYCPAPSFGPAPPHGPVSSYGPPPPYGPAPS